MDCSASGLFLYAEHADSRHDEFSVGAEIFRGMRQFAALYQMKGRGSPLHHEHLERIAMKTQRLVGLSALILIFATTLFAGRTPGGRMQERLATRSDFENLQPGDRVAMVCKMCDAISVTEIESQVDAIALCEEGAEIKCSSCGETARVVRGGPPSKGRPEVKFRNEHGVECMHMAKLDRHDAATTESGHAHH